MVTSQHQLEVAGVMGNWIHEGDRNCWLLGDMDSHGSAVQVHVLKEGFSVLHTVFVPHTKNIFHQIVVKILVLILTCIFFKQILCFCCGKKFPLRLESHTGVWGSDLDLKFLPEGLKKVGRVPQTPTFNPLTFLHDMFVSATEVFSS